MSQWFRCIVRCKQCNKQLQNDENLNMHIRNVHMIECACFIIILIWNDDVSHLDISTKPSPNYISTFLPSSKGTAASKQKPERSRESIWTFFGFDIITKDSLTSSSENKPSASKSSRAEFVSNGSGSLSSSGVITAKAQGPRAETKSNANSADNYLQKKRNCKTTYKVHMQESLKQTHLEKHPA